MRIKPLRLCSVSVFLYPQSRSPWAGLLCVCSNMFSQTSSIAVFFFNPSCPSETKCGDRQRRVRSLVRQIALTSASLSSVHLDKTTQSFCYFHPSDPILPNSTRKDREGINPSAVILDAHSSRSARRSTESWNIPRCGEGWGRAADRTGDLLCAFKPHTNI